MAGLVGEDEDLKRGMDAMPVARMGKATPPRSLIASARGPLLPRGGSLRIPASVEGRPSPPRRDQTVSKNRCSTPVYTQRSSEGRVSAPGGSTSGCPASTGRRPPRIRRTQEPPPLPACLSPGSLSSFLVFDSVQDRPFDFCQARLLGDLAS